MSESAVKRILQRIQDSLEQAEQKTVAMVKHEIDQAIELEEAAEEMTREELDLLSAYLKRDIESLSRFVAATGKGVGDWLKFDLQLLEEKLAGLLLSVADKTLLERQELEQELAAEGDDLYLAGETVMPGTFSCLKCGNIYQITRSEKLAACLECGGDGFRRQSSV